MNSEKILIEINVAGVNRSFDCIVPRTLPAKLLCRGFLELVEQSMGIPFGAYRQALLMSERTGRILSPEQTLDDAVGEGQAAAPGVAVGGEEFKLHGTDFPGSFQIGRAHV